MIPPQSSIRITDPLSNTSHAKTNGGYIVTGASNNILAITVRVMKTGQDDLTAVAAIIVGGNWSAFVADILAGDSYVIQATGGSCSDATHDVTFT